MVISGFSFFSSPGTVIIILCPGESPWQRRKWTKNRFVLLLETKGYFDVTKFRDHGRHVWVKRKVIISKTISYAVKNYLPIVNRNRRGVQVYDDKNQLCPVKFFLILRKN